MKTCKRGHDMEDPANVYKVNGGRGHGSDRCRACRSVVERKGEKPPGGGLPEPHLTAAQVDYRLNLLLKAENAMPWEVEALKKQASAMDLLRKKVKTGGAS